MSTPNRTALPPFSAIPTWIPLTVVLIVAFALRVREALLAPLWFDEIYTLTIASQPLGQALRVAATDVHPPLWTLLVHIWHALVGNHTLALRLLPILIGVATVAVLFGFARECFGRGIGLLAAALLAVQHRHLFVSQELRSFSLLTLALLVCMWMAWRWIRRGAVADGVGFVLAATIALYTHYLAGLVLAALAGATLVALRREPRRMLHWVAWNLAIAAAFAPQLVLFAGQMAQQKDHWIRPTGWAGLGDLARQISFGARYMVIPMAIAALLPLTRREQRAPAALLWWVALAPTLLTWALTEGGAHLFIVRYQFYTLPLWCALTAAGVLGLRTRAPAWGGALMFLTIGTRAAIIHRPPTETVEARRTIDALTPQLQPGDLVACADTHTWLGLTYHLPPGTNVRLLMAWDRIPYYEGAALLTDSARLAPDSLRARASGGARWWGVRMEHGGISSAAGAALIDSLGRGESYRLELVQLWGGQAGMSARLSP